MLLGDDEPKRASWSSERNRLLAMALEHHEMDVCQGCGQPRHESTGEDPPDYSPDYVECRGCALLADARSEEDKPGTQWFLEVRRHSRAGVVPR